MNEKIYTFKNNTDGEILLNINNKILILKESETKSIKLNEEQWINLITRLRYMFDRNLILIEEDDIRNNYFLSYSNEKYTSDENAKYKIYGDFSEDKLKELINKVQLENPNRKLNIITDIITLFSIKNIEKVINIDKFDNASYFERGTSYYLNKPFDNLFKNLDISVYFQPYLEDKTKKHLLKINWLMITPEDDYYKTDLSTFGLYTVDMKF